MRLKLQQEEIIKEVEQILLLYLHLRIRKLTFYRRILFRIYIRKALMGKLLMRKNNRIMGGIMKMNRAMAQLIIYSMKYVKLLLVSCHRI